MITTQNTKTIHGSLKHINMNPNNFTQKLETYQHEHKQLYTRKFETYQHEHKQLYTEA